MYLGVTGSGMFFKVLAVIGQPGEVLGFNVLQGISESHFAMAMVMAVGFAISCDMDELVPLAPIIESTHQPVSQPFAAKQ